MTLKHLTLLSTGSMLFTGLTVYWLTGLSAAQPGAVLAANVSPSPPDTPAAVAARSETPNTQEWGTAPVVDVQGARALHCTAKKMREWLRITCDGRNDSGGKPKDVRIQDAKILVTSQGVAGATHSAWDTPYGEVYTAQSSSFTSFVCPFVEGIDLEARFEWTDKSAALIVSWPVGAAEPRLKGTFRGSP